MKKLTIMLALALGTISSAQAATTYNISKEWTFTHSGSGYLAEIPAFDAVTNTLWVAGVKGVDVLDATTGSFLQHIDTSAYGSINSVSISNGMAAFAIENTTRTNAGIVQLYNTSSRSLASGTNTFTVGALPDMVTFTPDGTKILVANEGTPSVYGAQIRNTTPRNFGASPNDPVGSVTVIDVVGRTVAATATLSGVPTSGSHIRTNTGMDFEPEYIAVSADGSKAYVTLQEANAIGILDLNTNSFTQVVGLGVKDFSAPGNSIDPRDRNPVGQFGSYDVKGLYMPDGIATYSAGGQTYLVMANEGDYREDDLDKDRASTLGVTGDLSRLQVSLTDSTASDLYVAGARSFSIRDANGALVYDSGDILDKEAALRGIYDDGRSDDKGVEPEGVDLFTLGGRTIAAVGLERTLKGAIALFDITDPTKVSFIDMIVSDGDLAPEGLVAFEIGGKSYLAFANEGSNTTSLFSISAVPEPGSAAMLGLGLVAIVAMRRRQQ
ncbi:MAG: PEP-CTERM sorting domain-containing protein [Methylophilus methylotrophus]|uniref:PEP-CTERM sorting domain-containing protein n=1 Tax=Methylophilus methylotrophus TaxID=17 RepID=A0A5C7WMW0_METME|nr:MAG: PEP-CTERM sorting domain-containing protein [Methylophilus methylotrophus]